MLLAVLPGVALCYVSAHFAPGNFWLNWFSLLVLFAGVVALIVLMRRTPCPKCRQPLGHAAAKAAVMLWRFEARCAHCGVNVDEAMQGPASAK